MGAIWRWILLLLFIGMTTDTVFSQPRQLVELAKRPVVNLDKMGQAPEDVRRLEASVRDQQQLIELISQQKQLEELHLKCSCAGKYSFDVLKQLQKLRMLTIQFRSRETRNVCGFTNDPIDLSFVATLPKLQVLVLDWNGEVTSEQAVGRAANLLIARLPVTAFTPNLFTEQSVLRQFMFGNLASPDFSRYPAKWSAMTLSDGNYAAQFSIKNKKWRTYLKHYKKYGQDVQAQWPTTFFRKDEAGDTLYFLATNKADQQFRMKSVSPSTALLGQADGDNISKKVRYGRSKRIATFTGPQDFSLQLFRGSEEGEFALFTQRHFKSGEPDGVWLENNSDGQLAWKHIYEDGYLSYKFPLEFNEMPEIPEDISMYTSFAIGQAEGFYTEGELKKVVYYDGPKNDSNSRMLSIPYNRNDANGPVTLVEAGGDTTIKTGFLNGELHGPYFRRVNDSVTITCTLESGKLVGKKEIVRKETSTISFYDAGTLRDLRTIRNSDDKVLESLKWDESKLVYVGKAWHPNGVLARDYRLNLKQRAVGKEEQFHSNGKRKVIASYNDGKRHGVYEEFFENGKLKFRSSYQRGELNGATVLYHENGRVREKANYKNNGRHGEQFFYKADGALDRKVLYVNGKQVNSDE